MSNEITIAPVIVNTVGTTVAERKLSILPGASVSAVLALTNAGGAVGKAARAGAANSGLYQIAGHASRGNYRPLGEYLAAQLGETIVISGRAMFEALPDMFEMRIAKVKSTKSGGYRTDKHGMSVPNAALKQALALKGICVDMIAQAAALHEARKAAEQPTLADAS